MSDKYHEQVANKLIEQLKQGTAPWQRPWQPGELSLPYNAATGKQYRGMNSMWLAMQGHSDPRWMTYRQASAEGAQVKRGSKGTSVIYWKFREEQQVKDADGKPILGPDGKPKMVTVELERPRSFLSVVFNAEQISGLPPLQPAVTRPEPERHARAEAILAMSGADIRHEAGNRAYYRPSTDSITLPERSQFDTADGYYATALHELGHWTGHSSRLDRDLSYPFGSEGYAREELRAEIASLMLGERLEIGHDPGQHASYVSSWIKVLEENPREIFRAAADAEAIRGYVMEFEKEYEQHQYVDPELGFGLPNDWAGRIQVQGNVLEIDSNGDNVTAAVAVGETPTFWGMYAELKDGTHEWLADYPTEAQARRIARHLELDSDDPDKGNTRYVVCNEHTLCFSEPGNTMLGILGSDPHGRASDKGPFMPGPNDNVRPATAGDFARFGLAIPTTYLVHDDSTLCYAEPGNSLLGVLAGNVHGKDWRNGPFTPGPNDNVRPATLEDFERFRVQLPLNFVPQVDQITLREARVGAAAVDAIQTAGFALRKQGNDQSEAVENYLSGFVEADPELAKEAANAWQRDIARYSAMSGLSLESVNSYAGFVEQVVEKRQSQILPPDDPQQLRHAANLERGLEAFRDQDWTHAKWNGKIVVSPLEDDTYSIYVNGNDGSYRPLLSELTYQHAHELVDLLNVQDEIKEARSAIQDDMGLPDDPNLLRDHANRGELYVMRRSNHDLTVKEEDVEIGLRFRDLMEQTAQRKDSVGTEAKRALTYFNGLYEDLVGEVAADQAETHRWKLIGYDIRTGTGSASLHDLPNEAAVTQAAVMLAALSSGDRLNSLLPDKELAGNVPTESVIRHHPPENPMPDRTYLAVPYSEKDQAKATAKQSGFKLEWDKESKAWYAPAGADLSRMERWREGNQRVQPLIPESPEQQFAAALKEAGLVLDGAPIADGKMHRVKVVGDKGGATSGAYAFHLEGHTPGGFIQNHKDGVPINWKYQGTVASISAEERQRLQQEARERSQRRASATADQYESVAKAAQMLWKEAPEATTDNAYCKAKNITEPGLHGLRVVPKEISAEAQAAGIRIAANTKQAKTMREAEPDARVFLKGDLLVPVQDADGKIWSLQSINTKMKGLMKGGQKSGNFSVAGLTPEKFMADMAKNPTAPIVMAEGYATADTVARLNSSGLGVVVAFDANNLDAVAGELRKRWPDRPLLIAADNDHERTGKAAGQVDKNEGVSKALEAAEKHGGGVMIPPFSMTDKGTDWNDYAAQHGDDDAKKELEKRVAQAKAEAAIYYDRMMSLAREREAEARDNPNTTADDVFVAQERSAAQTLMSEAVAGNTRTRADAKDALTANGKSRASVAAVSNLARSNAKQDDDLKEQRQAVHDGHNVSSESERAAHKVAGNTVKPARKPYHDQGAEL